MNGERDKPKTKTSPQREHPLENLQAPLMTSLGFDEEDLLANRDRVLSDRQCGNLINQQAVRIVLALLVSSLYLGLTAILLGRGAGGTNLLDRLLGIILTWGMLVLLISSAGSRWMPLKEGIEEGLVENVEGYLAKKIIRLGRNRYDYRLLIGGQDFGVGWTVFRTFQHKGRYRVYYLPHSETILSAEFLPDSDPVDDEE
jgi:hypothetical protein